MLLWRVTDWAATLWPQNRLQGLLMGGHQHSKKLDRDVWTTRESGKCSWPCSYQGLNSSLGVLFTSCQLVSGSRLDNEGSGRIKKLFLLAQTRHHACKRNIRLTGLTATGVKASKSATRHDEPAKVRSQPAVPERLIWSNVCEFFGSG
jgi:hypothetical protein